MGEVYPNPVAYLPEEISPGYCALLTAEPDLIVCENVGSYVLRNPEKTVLYGVVAGNLETLLARQRQRDRVVPRFVELELRAFLDCGVLSRGFLFEGSLRCLQTGPACPVFLQKKRVLPVVWGAAHVRHRRSSGGSRFP